jgi:hypothetical protein
LGTGKSSNQIYEMVMTSSLQTGKLPEGMLKGTTRQHPPVVFVEATHMMMVAERCQKQGIYFAAVSWCPKVRRWKKIWVILVAQSFFV